MVPSVLESWVPTGNAALDVDVDDEHGLLANNGWPTVCAFASTRNGDAADTPRYGHPVHPQIRCASLYAGYRTGVPSST